LQKQGVFWISFLLVLFLALLGVFSQELLAALAAQLHETIIRQFGWAYLLSAFIFLVFVIILAFSRFGDIRLGQSWEKPQYSYFGWFSMLFAAGMGIGLIFWGVAEPLTHYANPPEGMASESGEAAAFAMRHAFFHWGLHPWAIYIVMSLSIAYFSFRRGMPPLISSCFYPLLGEHVRGVAGKLIDILAVFATVFGIATSLGLGAMQITSGLSRVFGLPDTMTSTLVVIVVVTILYMLSSASGLDRGIQLLSKANILAAILLLFGVFVLGPTAYICDVFTNTVGQYFNRLFEMSLASNPFVGNEWTKDWTLFYWAWWIAWSPFVGVFVARISRGRTIREFVLGALLVPTLLTFLWFSVFGGAGLHLVLEQKVALSAAEVDTVLFDMFEYYPFSGFLSLVAVVLLLVFFVTSGDSATFVLGMMTSGGSMQPSLGKKLAWGVIQSAVAAILLVAGGLTALQQMAISAALPFTLIMLLLCVNLVKGLQAELGELKMAEQKQSPSDSG
jgi:glycine betaine transporter